MRRSANQCDRKRERARLLSSPGATARTRNHDHRQIAIAPGGKSDHGKAMSRPAIAGNRVFMRPRVMDLKTGKLLDVAIPKGGCGTYACTTHTLVYRNGNVTMWDALGKTTTSWNRLRPGCWLSTIPACGMLLSPEAGGGCSCGKWMEMSTGFVPREWDSGR